MLNQTWNLSQVSQACLCKVFAAGVKFYFVHTLFCCKFVFLCVQDLDKTITVKFQIIIIIKKLALFLIP